MRPHSVKLGFVDGDFRCGAHVCQIYSDEADRDRVVRQFVVAGRRSGESCACFSDHVSRAVLLRQLAAEGLAERQSEDDLAVSDTQRAYFEPGSFEPERMLAHLSAFYARSSAQGYPAARVIGEMTAAITTIAGGNRLLEYEARVSILLRTQTVTTVCQYHARDFGGAAIFDILRVHPLVMVAGAVVENPLFTSPEDLLRGAAGRTVESDGRALARLLMMQSVLLALPEPEAILAFACRGLSDLPGVVRVTLGAAEDGSGPVAHVPIQSALGRRGEFALELRDPARFAALEPYVRNFAALVALILDERARRVATAQSHAELDRKVQERTAELSAQISERKAVEAELQLSRDMLRSTLDSVPHAIFWKDRSGRYLGCNQSFAHALGREPAAVVGLTDPELPWRPEDVARYRATDLQVLATGLPCGPYLSEMRSLDGAVRWLQVTKTPLRDRGGEVYAVLGVYEDITTRRQAEQDREQLQRQLAQSQKMESIGRLAGGVAHDFNNMLQAMLGNACLALLEPNLPAAVRGHLEEIHRAAERSGRLTQQLLAFARKQTISPRRIDLNEAVASMLKMLRRLIGEDIKLDWRPGAGLPAVRLDPAQVDQVLANLVVNARDAIRGTGEIVIATGRVTLSADEIRYHFDAEPGDYVTLRVRDNGSGLAPDAREHLFEPFFTTKPEGRGTGLGLATVYGIVKQNRGAILMHSEPRVGTEFQLCFPPAGESNPVATVPAPAPGVSGDAVTVLVVEDEEAILFPTQRILENHGYSVLAASRPEEAIRCAQQFAGPIQLLITDVIMPQMNGHELYRRLAEIKPGLRCVFMSGYTADILEQTELSGATGVVFQEKPFTPAELVARAHQALHPDPARGAPPDERR